MVHAINYKETYERTYFVKADTYEEACDKLREAIEEGDVEGPDNCCDTEYTDDSEGWNPDYFNDPGNIDVE